MRFNRRWIAALLLFLSTAASVQSTTQPRLVLQKKYIMGTVFEIAAYDPSSQHASTAIDQAFQEIVHVDDELSNYKPESSLSKLNRSAHFHAETVPSDLYRVIEAAVQFSKLSDGKFDISVAPFVNLWKAALSGDAEPTLEQQQETKACVGYKKIEFIAPRQISFRSPCMQLDLGAIGKGYAVDRAAEVLRASGILNALINAGGSTMLAMGAPPGQSAWLVHLRDPSHRIDPQVMLKDESVSTSEQTTPSLLGKNSPGHIIDPETGQPVQTEFAVSVIAKTGMMSDSLSTTLLLLGPAQGKVLIARMGEVSAIWIAPDSRLETVMNGPQILFGRKA
ncbi:MAG: FAD:protein FMN transferase [Acidobacteriota bacterium]